MEIAISDVPVAPVAVSFASDPLQEVPMARAAPARRASRTRRILGWAIDLGFLASLLAAHVVLAARLAGAPHQRLSLVFAAPLLWLVLGCGLALAWSWTFVALWGRTPGMALTGQRLRMLHGGAPTPMTAFVRALLAVLCGAPGLFGFVVALFDARGQTLHDKLCRCVAIVD
ncbi:MAG TPA: RDD family protein [Myxococcales bacterium]